MNKIMTTIKSYTDINQSKKLADILPLESADMCWTNHYYGTIRSSMTISAKTIKEYKELLESFHDSTDIDVFYPCWSLAALLGVLPTMIGGEFDEVLQLKMDKHLRGFHFWYISLDTDKVKEGLDIVELNPVDTCYELILKLHELKML